MTRAELHAVWTARPFVPFLLRLPDGRALSVPHPEFLSISPDSRIAVVWVPRGGGHRVDLMLVSDIEFLRPRRSRRSA